MLDHLPLALVRWNCLCYRAVLDAGAAAGAKVRVDASRLFLDLDFEVSGFAFDGFQIRVCDQLDVQMPADLDQFR